MADVKTVTVLLPEPLKRWLEAVAARRMAEGRPHGERSMSAIVVDLIEAAKAQDEREAA